MFKPIAIALLLATTFLQNSSAQEEKWVSLFNGKDLMGWEKVHDVQFDVNEKNLRLVTGMGWLRTEKEYKDFILEFEMKALSDEKYDSGFFFRAGFEGKPWPKVGWQINLKHDGMGTLVRGYQAMEKPEVEKVPLDTWVLFRLTVKGETAKLEMNGKTLWEVDYIEPEKGYLGIQAENKSFEFRNLRIQEL